MQDNLLEHVQAVLSTTAPRWQRLADMLPIELLARATAPGEWSALKCLQHLLDTEEWVFPGRVEALLVEQDFAAFDPDTQGRQAGPREAPGELAAAFAQRRAASLALLARVTPADLSRMARHSELSGEPAKARRIWYAAVHVPYNLDR